MAKVLTESNSYDATITVPQNGDRRDAPSVEVSFQGLANRTKYLKTALYATGAETPEAVLTADPGSYYFATDDGLYGAGYIKTAGTAATGWHRLISQRSDDDSIYMIDFKSGSDHTQMCQLQKVSSGTIDRFTIEMDKYTVTLGTAIMLHSEDDSSNPSEIHLRPATNNLTLYRFDDTAFYHTRSGTACDLGTSGDPWRNIYSSGTTELATASVTTFSATTATVSGTLTANGNTVLGNSASDTVTLNGTLTGAADAPVTLNGFLTVNGNATLGNSSGDVVTIAGVTTIGNGLGVSNGLAIGSGANGTLDVSGACDFASTLNVVGAISSDAGASIPKKSYTMPDASTSVSWNSANLIYIPATTAVRALTLATAGVPDGAVYEVYVRRGTVTTYAVTIGHSDGVVSMKNASGGYTHARFEVNSGSLRLIGGEYIA